MTLARRLKAAALALAAGVGSSFAAAGGAALAAGPVYVAGMHASPGGARGVRATMIVRARNARQADLEIYEVRSGRIVRAYDVAMTQRAHLIVIGADFRTFAHLHPSLGADGRFRVRLRVPNAGRYYVYADTEPHALGRQVFRFGVAFGRTAPAPERPNPGPPRARVRAGPYTVTLASLQLNARRPTVLTAKILRGGRPAPGLRAYLGGAAHAVFINVATLAYLHVHALAGEAVTQAPGPMDMLHMRMDAGGASHEGSELPADAPVPASLRLYVPAAAPGTYRLWLQFRGADGIFVAPFVVRAG